MFLTGTRFILFGLTIRLIDANGHWEIARLIIVFVTGQSVACHGFKGLLHIDAFLGGSFEVGQAVIFYKKRKERKSSLISVDHKQGSPTITPTLRFSLGDLENQEVLLSGTEKMPTTRFSRSILFPSTYKQTMIIRIISETKRSNVLRMENDRDHVEQLVRENLASSSPTIETKFVRSHPSPRRNSQHHGRRRRPNFGNALDQPCPKSSFRPRRWINRKGIDFLPAW